MTTTNTDQESNDILIRAIKELEQQEKQWRDEFKAWFKETGMFGHCMILTEKGYLEAKRSSQKEIDDLKTKYELKDKFLQFIREREVGATIKAVDLEAENAELKGRLKHEVEMIEGAARDEIKKLRELVKEAKSVIDQLVIEDDNFIAIWLEEARELIGE